MENKTRKSRKRGLSINREIISANEEYGTDSFYRLPRELFTDERYSKLSTDAKLLYAIILDRMSLSESNGWHDEQGRIYQIFTMNEAAALLRCGKEKVCRLFADLEEAELIERKRQGLGKPSVIYLRKTKRNRVGKSEIKSFENQTSGGRKNRTQEVGKSKSNYTEYNQTENSYTDLSIKEIDADEIEEQVKTSMEYDILSERVSADRLDEIVSIITELMCIREPIIRIGGKEQPRTLVHMRLMRLRCEHIEYVLECMNKNSARIRDIKAYLISALFNASATMTNFYDAEVRADGVCL